MKRGRFLVNMVKEKDKENISPPIIHTQHETLKNDIKISTSDEILPKKTHSALSVVNISIPSTSKQETIAPNYYISPIRSDESDIDDSDADPNFRLVHKMKMSSKVIPTNASLTSSSTSSSSSSSSNANSSSDTEDDIEQVDPQNVMFAEINAQKPVMEKKIKKRVRKPSLEIESRKSSEKLGQTLPVFV